MTLALTFTPYEKQPDLAPKARCHNSRHGATSGIRDRAEYRMFVAIGKGDRPLPLVHIENRGNLPKTQLRKGVFKR